MLSVSLNVFNNKNIKERDFKINQYISQSRTTFLLGIFRGIIYRIILMYVNFIFFIVSVSNMFRNLSKVLI